MLRRVEAAARSPSVSPPAAGAGETPAPTSAPAPGGHLSRRGRLVARARLALSVLASLWLIALLVAFSDAGVGIVPFLLGVYGAALLGAGWLALLALAARLPPPRPARLPWLIVPAAVVAVLLLDLFAQPPGNPLFRLRFRASRAALTAVAESVRVFPPPAPGQRVGLFRIAAVDVRGNQVRFLTADCGVVDSCGVVYSPLGPPQAVHEDRFQRLGGPWYHLYQGF